MWADAGSRELLGSLSYGRSVLCRSCAWTFGGVAVSQTLARRSYAQTRGRLLSPPSDGLSVGDAAERHGHARAFHNLLIQTPGMER